MRGITAEAECPCGADIGQLDGGAWFTVGSWPLQLRCYPGATGLDGEATHEPIEGTVRVVR